VFLQSELSELPKLKEGVFAPIGQAFEESVPNRDWADGNLFFGGRLELADFG
jgi:hypothetical protein